MLIALIFFGIFFFLGKNYGEDPDRNKGLLLSVIFSISILIILTGFMNPKFAGMGGAMTGLGFYSGFKRAKKKLEEEDEIELEKMQSVICKHCNDAINVTEEELQKGAFYCPTCNKENRL